jgi:hypothetical protein
MEARLPFVAPHALSRKARVAAGATSTACLFKVTKIGSGCPSFDAQRTVAPAREQESSEHLSKHLPLFDAAPNFEPASSHQPQRLGAFSERYSVQVSVGRRVGPALVCFVIQTQSKAASPRAWPNHSFKRTRLRRSA